MLEKLYSVEQNKFHKTIKICGIKFKVFDKKLMHLFVQGILEKESVFPERNIFLYSNLDKLTKEQKIWYLSQILYNNAGYFPNLKNPKTFNEKINWMKLNYYDPNQKNAIDKYEFKNYIKEKLGDGYTIPLIAGPFDDVNDIDFKSLPEKFVIKTTTNGSGVGVFIVKDKKRLNINKMKAELNNLLQDWKKAYYSTLAAGYKNIKPRIIIEEYMEQLDSNGLYDYKFHCFHGEPKFV